jgi:outer membrane protein assembly factor BamE (lipoprotein component of BamABCDE complex)
MIFSRHHIFKGMNRTIFTAFIFSLLVLQSCSPIVATRGNFISEHKYTKIAANTSKRSDVVNNWGPPTAVSSFDQNTWYYIGETTEQKGIFAPEVVARRIIKVQFDKNDNETVTSIEDMDVKQAKNIEIVSRKTPTAGKEYTVLQQMIGNLGKYNENLKK